MSHWMTSGKSRLKAKQKNTFAARAKLAANATNAATADALIGAVQMALPSNRNLSRRGQPRFQRGVNPMLARGVSVPIPSRYPTQQGVQSVAQAAYQHYNNQQQENSMHDQQQQQQQQQPRRRRIRDPAVSISLRERPQPQRVAFSHVLPPPNVPPQNLNQFSYTDSMTPIQYSSDAPQNPLVSHGIPRFQRRPQHYQEDNYVHGATYNQEYTTMNNNAGNPSYMGNGIPRFRRQQEQHNFNSSHHPIDHLTSPSSNYPFHAATQSSNNSSLYNHNGGIGFASDPREGWPLREFTNSLPHASNVSRGKYIDTLNSCSASYVANSPQPIGSSNLSPNNTHPFGQQHSPPPFGVSAPFAQHLQQSHGSSEPAFEQSNSSFGTFGNHVAEDEVFHFYEGNGDVHQSNILPTPTQARFKHNPFGGFAYDEEQSTTGFGRLQGTSSVSLATTFSGRKRPFEMSVVDSTNTSRLGVNEGHISEATMNHATCQGIAHFRRRQLEASQKDGQPNEMENSDWIEKRLPSAAPDGSIDGNPRRRRARLSAPQPKDSDHERSTKGSLEMTVLTTKKVHRPNLGIKEEHLTSTCDDSAPPKGQKSQEQREYNLGKDKLRRDEVDQRSGPESSDTESSSSTSAEHSSATSTTSRKVPPQILPTQQSSKPEPTTKPGTALLDTLTGSAHQSRKADRQPAAQLEAPPALRFFNNGVEVNFDGVPLSRPTTPAAPPKSQTAAHNMWGFGKKQHSPDSSTISSKDSIVEILQASSGKSLWELTGL